MEKAFNVKRLTADHLFQFLPLPFLVAVLPMRPATIELALVDLLAGLALLLALRRTRFSPGSMLVLAMGATFWVISLSGSQVKDATHTAGLLLAAFLIPLNLTAATPD